MRAARLRERTVDDGEEAAREGVRTLVPAAAFQAIETFVDVCRSWGSVSNLVSEQDRERLWSRHVADSVQLLPLAADAGERWIDIGSGGGFPGMIVALAREGTAMTLVEANRKKAAFLVSAAAATRARVVVEPRRAESVPAAPFDVVSARAVAPLERLLDLARPFFGPTTLGLFPKGRGALTELEAAQRRHRFVAVVTPSRLADEAAIVSITKLGG